MTTTTKYVGGPLDGTDAVRIGATWSPYRNDQGEWISDLQGRAEMKRRMPRHYYEYIPEHGVYVFGPLFYRIGDHLAELEWS